MVIRECKYVWWVCSAILMEDARREYMGVNVYRMEYQSDRIIMWNCRVYYLPVSIIELIIITLFDNCALSIYICLNLILNLPRSIWPFSEFLLKILCLVSYSTYSCVINFSVFYSISFPLQSSFCPTGHFTGRGKFSVKLLYVCGAWR